MTAKLNYARLVEAIYGQGSVSFDPNGAETNHVIGALAKANEFHKFQAAFDARLRRLYAATAINPGLRASLLNTINLVADRGNWDGAFAELAVLDYFFADARTGPSQVQVDVTVPASETLAREMGGSNANLDLVLNSFDIALDTKLLSDKIDSILQGIFDEVRRKKGIAQLTIIPSYEPDQDFEPFQDKRRALVTELESMIDTTARPSAAQSAVIPGLDYQFAWKADVYASANLYSPEGHGANHHRLLFKHAKKFSTRRPSGIVFVHFPWSGEKLFPIGDATPKFFRSLCDSFFQGYTTSSTPAAQLNRAFKTAMLASEATTHLSAVVFLEDKTATADDPHAVNVRVSFALNRSAKHPLLGSDFERYMADRKAFDLAQL